MIGLYNVEQPKNDHDQKNRAQATAWIVTPVARIRVSREGPEKQQKKNNDNNQFQDVPPIRNLNE
jgi:hypothetical protein